jgi:hypothetical protein
MLLPTKTKLLEIKSAMHLGLHVVALKACHWFPEERYEMLKKNRLDKKSIHSNPLVDSLIPSSKTARKTKTRKTKMNFPLLPEKRRLRWFSG